MWLAKLVSALKLQRHLGVSSRRRRWSATQLAVAGTVLL